MNFNENEKLKSRQITLNRFTYFGLFICLFFVSQTKVSESLVAYSLFYFPSFKTLVRSSFQGVEQPQIVTINCNVLIDTGSVTILYRWMRRCKQHWLVRSVLLIFFLLLFFFCLSVRRFRHRNKYLIIRMNRKIMGRTFCLVWPTPDSNLCIFIQRNRIPFSI